MGKAVGCQGGFVIGNAVLLALAGGITYNGRCTKKDPDEWGCRLQEFKTGAEITADVWIFFEIYTIRG